MVGPVVYTKTSGGHEVSDWADGVFQKDQRYDGQKEFRFALVGLTGAAEEENIVLKLGSCKEVVSIVIQSSTTFVPVPIEKSTSNPNTGLVKIFCVEKTLLSAIMPLYGNEKCGL